MINEEPFGKKAMNMIKIAEKKIIFRKSIDFIINRLYIIFIILCLLSIIDSYVSLCGSYSIKGYECKGFCGRMTSKESMGTDVLIPQRGIQ